MFSQNLTLADIYHLAWGTVLVDELGVNVLLDESKRPYVTRKVAHYRV